MLLRLENNKNWVWGVFWKSNVEGRRMEIRGGGEREPQVRGRQELITTSISLSDPGRRWGGRSRWLCDGGHGEKGESWLLGSGCGSWGGDLKRVIFLSAPVCLCTFIRWRLRLPARRGTSCSRAGFVGEGANVATDAAGMTNELVLIFQRNLRPGAPSSPINPPPSVSPSKPFVLLWFMKSFPPLSLYERA